MSALRATGSGKSVLAVRQRPPEHVLGSMGVRLPASPLVLDEQITPSVRIRHWRQGGPCPEWPAVAHDAVEVACILRGAVRYTVGRRQHELGARGGFLVPDGHEHETWIADGTEAVSLWLDRRLMLDLESAMGVSRRLDAGMLDDPSVSSLAGLILEEARRHDAGSIVAIETLTEALAVRLLRASGEETRPTTRDPRLHRALAFIAESYADPLSVEEMAQHAGMSRYHFSRAFRAHTGPAPWHLCCLTCRLRITSSVRRDSKRGRA